MLLCRAGTTVLALALRDVGETMRPMAVSPLAGTDELVRGLAIVRGEARPVIDGRTLLGLDASEIPGRFVTLKLGARRAMLAVDHVIGVRELDADTTHALPALVAEMARERLSRLGTLDGELLVVLEAAALVPPAIFRALDESPT